MTTLDIELWQRVAHQSFYMWRLPRNEKCPLQKRAPVKQVGIGYGGLTYEVVPLEKHRPSQMVSCQG